METAWKDIVAVLGNHPWILLILILAFGVYKFLTIPKITDAVANHISMDVDTMTSLKEATTTIKEIRTDQLISNLERKEMGQKINEIDERLEMLEQEVKTLKPLRCDKPDCVNRVG